MKQIDVSQCELSDFWAAEAIKTLRANVVFGGDEIRTIALTSFGTAEGKTTVAFQLAASLARVGKTVLLVDADLRKSTLASRLNISGVIEGLSQYLSGEIDLLELVYQTDVPGLFIIFAGSVVPNAVEALGSDRFKKLIAAARKAFDYTIVDTAPLGQVVDCAVMAPEMDGVLMVINAAKNSYKQERRIQSQLEKAGGKILGVVLNRVDLGDRGSDYAKAYNYGGCKHNR